ncbi:hypothetical protein [Rhodophyticola sp. CCM32]|nr:hypothetical protein [Rhodophyticola sp. CCM32]
MKTALRQRKWDAPDYWRQMEDPPRSRLPQKQRDQRSMRRWLRDTGIL